MPQKTHRASALSLSLSPLLPASSRLSEITRGEINGGESKRDSHLFEVILRGNENFLIVELNSTRANKFGYQWRICAATIDGTMANFIGG